jgi:hypothetical protein
MIQYLFFVFFCLIQFFFVNSFTIKCLHLLKYFFVTFMELTISEQDSMAEVRILYFRI